MRVSVNNNSFSQLYLFGDHSFYNNPNYEKQTKADFAQEYLLPTHYVKNTERKVVRIAKLILCIVIVPVGAYYVLHNLVGKVVVMVSSHVLMGLSRDHATNSRAKINLHERIYSPSEQGPSSEIWQYKRVTLEVDGYKIDAAIMGSASTFSNGRWVLSSNGLGGFYEDRLSNDKELKHLVRELKANAIIFNYPGVGASNGMPNRKTLAKVHQTMLAFLEDKEKGIGAKEIICNAHSIGGGVQNESLKNHAYKKDVKYVVVNGRTFSSVCNVVYHYSTFPLWILIKALGWNINTVETSKKLPVPEIIINTANVKEYTEVKDSQLLIHDGFIDAKASLGKALLDDKACAKENKVFLAVPDTHNTSLTNTPYLATLIEKQLAVLTPCDPL